MSAVMPYCTGTWCPLKGSCAHYYSPLSKRPDSNYYPSVPYDHKAKKCKAFLPYNRSQVLFELEELINKRNESKN
jgi:hypothetical protein